MDWLQTLPSDDIAVRIQMPPVITPLRGILEKVLHGQVHWQQSAPSVAVGSVIVPRSMVAGVTAGSAGMSFTRAVIPHIQQRGMSGTISKPVVPFSFPPAGASVWHATVLFRDPP